MDLHDGVVQALFVVGLSLHAAEGVVDDAAQVRTRLSEAIDSIDGTISDLRHYIFGLRSPREGRLGHRIAGAAAKREQSSRSVSLPS
jgi:signal transduction histidine kinase